ncbi:MAG TPA: hypothetical protein VFB38_06275 [Chthonomonadaceae bacterium]|nr:hypothetical protein [Chthonomonadaceae bacterium]
MEQRSSPPPTLLQETLDGIEIPNDFRAKLSELLHRKRGGALGMGAPDADLSRFAETEMQRIESFVSTLPDVTIEPDTLNALAWKELGLD